MGSLEALEVYWSSPAALASLTAFAFIGIAIAVAYRRAGGQTTRRLRLLRSGTWLSVGFWTFVAGSLLLCFLLADPVEYGPATAKAVAVLSIGLAVGMASVVSYAISRGTPARARVPEGEWAPEGGSLQQLASRLGSEAGLPRVRVRVVEAASLSLAEPPETIVVSRALLDVLSEDELRAVFLHELCHLTERDGPEKAFVGAMSRILPFDPFLRLIVRASHREREYRADEHVAKRMGGGALASALVKLSGRVEGAGPARRHPRIEERLDRLRALAYPTTSR